MTYAYLVKSIYPLLKSFTKTLLFCLSYCKTMQNIQYTTFHKLETILEVLTSPFMALMASEAFSGFAKVIKPKPLDLCVSLSLITTTKTKENKSYSMG